MTKQGRLERALKIYLHALALDPHHSDLLNSYGEFLELYKDDVVTAEHHYCKALAFNPSHDRALQNHKRTLPLVEELDRMRFTQVDAKLKSLLRVPDNHPGLRRVTSEQYFRHIYHTTAMEGNTFTLSQTRSFVENRIVISGKSIIEHNEILGMEAALHYLNTSLVKRLGTIKMDDILQIHKRVLGFVDPIGSGVFRTTQVFVGNFMPPPPQEITNLMNDFIEWLNSEETFEALHPIEMAALAHYKLVYIHPFYDGNGRTSRLLMNLILMMAGYPPIILPVEQKQNYYQYLETANNGDVRPFIRFISSCAERTLDEYLLASVTSVASNRSRPELLAQQKQATTTLDGGNGGDDYGDGLTIVVS
ncbi:hypothetical protein HELRODRAFT_100335 [Helobdella robusta]|uniref:protein adenylyltransferase n=1 Tax=Helobdella robusta TaxID=6412 RepID=T1ECZ2_HELRO|nr:hypothetical protein HELRODRAFT_100335 [Helobdella robusta]ESO03201.1 hypothetical protein HELRODRAFT_100335 [Helobdella robusta]